MSLIFFAKVARISPRYKMHLVGGLHAKCLYRSNDWTCTGKKGAKVLAWGQTMDLYEHSRRQVGVFYVLEIVIRTMAGQGLGGLGQVFLENFCNALHQMEHLTERPAEMKQEIFTLLFDSAEIATFMPDEKIRYEKDMTTERDRYNQLVYAEVKGMEKGLEKGRAEERSRIVEAMRRQGIPNEVIAKVVEEQDRM